MPSLLSFALIFAVAATVTAATVPVVRRVAISIDAVDWPNARRINLLPTPNLGGTSLLLGFYAALGVAWATEAFDPVFATSSEVSGVVLAATIVYVVGLIDDLRNVSAPAKMAGMVLAGSVLSVAGVSILYFRVPFADFIVLAPDLSALVTVLWVIGMINAVNFIDGLDGLAAGIAAIAAGAFFLYGLRLAEADLLRPDNMSPLLAIIVAGVCTGFLPYNFHPAKIFMGDAGALLLGLLLAASTISVGGRTADQFSGQTYFFFAPLFIPLFILGVPIFDTVFAIVRRAANRQGVAGADKGHLHHRLMNLGHGHRRSVVILWIWTALLSALVLYPTFTGEGDAVVPVGLFAFCLLLFTLFTPGARQTRRTRQEDHQGRGGPEQALRPQVSGGEETCS